MSKLAKLYRSTVGGGSGWLGPFEIIKGFIYPGPKQSEEQIEASELFAKGVIVEVDQSKQEEVKNLDYAYPGEKEISDDERKFLDMYNAVSLDSRNNVLGILTEIYEREIGTGTAKPMETITNVIDKTVSADTVTTDVTATGNEKVVKTYTKAQLDKMSEKKLSDIFKELELDKGDATKTEMVEMLVNYFANIAPLTV